MKKTLIVIGLSFILTACASDINKMQEITALPSQTTSIMQSATPSSVIEARETFTPTSRTSSNRSSTSLYPTAPPIQFANLGEGVSREIARATDTVLQPTIENPLSFESQPVSITFEEFYDGYDMRHGLILSQKLLSLDGIRVRMEGYVAPPLKPRLDFFVLTRIQLAYCPFCSSEAEWPSDMALIYLPETMLISSEYPVVVIGTMEIGTIVDAETNMVSIVRIYAESIEQLR